MLIPFWGLWYVDFRYQSVNLKAVSKEKATQFYDNIKDELLDDVEVPPVKKSKQGKNWP